MAYREGIIRFHSDFRTWCFDEGYQVQELQEGDQVTIRILDCLLPGRVAFVQGEQCRLSYRDYETWSKIEIALCRDFWYSGVLELEISNIVG
ncbi:hypothetical protein J2S03_003343 [Alicyclobacillus cycloheptanicus]|uniref:DUF5348 domain-containing protein n=1 Tax=Alicyclobacillus cycloheptanicus TaxID=1457 RepID=A0ABT9XMD3_9BACL|nr:hypothetical protein [Alicyclobacillus cycloheptanicus]